MKVTIRKTTPRGRLMLTKPLSRISRLNFSCSLPSSSGYFAYRNVSYNNEILPSGTCNESLLFKRVSGFSRFFFSFVFFCFFCFVLFVRPKSYESLPQFQTLLFLHLTDCSSFNNEFRKLKTFTRRSWFYKL